MNRVKIWLKETRAPFLTATIVPILLGAVMGWHQTGSFHWGYFWLTLIGGIFMHLGTNIANDYFDHLSGNDWANKTPTPFSGGSRMIQEGLLPPVQVLAASLICFTIGGLIGLYLNYKIGGNVILILGVIGVFLGFFYTGNPIRIVYRGFGLGELAVGVGFGPVMVLGAYYVQTAQIAWPVLFASIPVGILIALVLYINEFPDYNADKYVGKKTLPVQLGKKTALWLYLGFITITYLVIIAGMALRILPLWSFMVIVTVPVALKASFTAAMHYDEVTKLIPANASTIVLHLSIGLLLTISFIIDKLLLP